MSDTIPAYLVSLGIIGAGAIWTIADLPNPLNSVN